MEDPFGKAMVALTGTGDRAKEEEVGVVSEAETEEMEEAAVE